MSKDADLRELGNTLHKRLLDRADIRVSAEIAELFLPSLVKRLGKRFPNLRDPHLVDSVAIDTMMSYFKHPERFDPSRGSLAAYLYMDACGDLLNALKPLQNVVEVGGTAAEHVIEKIIGDSDPEQELLEKTSPLVTRALEHVADGTDREMVLMLMDGVRESASYAEVLGIQDLPAEEQAAAVKRHKDRLKKSLGRSISKWLKRGQ